MPYLALPSPYRVLPLPSIPLHRLALPCLTLHCPYLTVPFPFVTIPDRFLALPSNPPDVRVRRAARARRVLPEGRLLSHVPQRGAQVVQGLRRHNDPGTCFYGVVEAFG